jgi:hypothetical protein
MGPIFQKFVSLVFEMMTCFMSNQNFDADHLTYNSGNSWLYAFTLILLHGNGKDNLLVTCI